MKRPAVRYAKSGDVSIAYQVTGRSGPDLVYVSGWVSNVDLMWDDRFLAPFLNRIASFSRLITFDKRGVGLSDRVPVDRLPTIEQRMDDVRAVLDAVGSKRAFIVGHSEGSVMSALFAATYPDRVSGLILYGGYAARKPQPDYPWAPTPEERQTFFDDIQRSWGEGFDIGVLAPSIADDREYCDSLNRYFRSSASPAAALALARMNTDADIRDVLSSISVPTLVIHRSGDLDAHVGGARYMATKIPGARLVELDGADHLPWTGNSHEVLDEIESFVTGTRTVSPSDRMLATVLFTDIVDSTRLAAELGDEAWQRLLARHDTLVRDEIGRFRGTVVKSTGDGFLATFDGPARAIHCAVEITRKTSSIGIQSRGGLHAGEIVVRGGDIGGIAVHLAARVIGKARDGRVAVSRTVKDLVAGSRIEFTDLGTHELAGIPGDWQIFEVRGE
jgi:pimeloyl-ACP methyl ester carboxylesterase